MKKNRFRRFFGVGLLVISGNCVMMAQNADWRIEAFDEATKIRLANRDEVGAFIVKAEPEMKGTFEKAHARDLAGFKVGRIAFLIQLRDNPSSINWSASGPFTFDAPDISKNAAKRLSDVDSEFRQANLEFHRSIEAMGHDGTLAESAAIHRHFADVYRIELDGFNAMKRLRERVAMKWKETSQKKSP